VGNARNAVGGKDGKKPKICYGCGHEGHFAGDKKGRAREQACRKSGRIKHFQFKCRDGEDKGIKKAGTGRERFRGGRFRDRNNKANFVEDERLSAGVVRQSPEFAFTVCQRSDHLNSSNGAVSLTVGGVDLPNVLINSGATCNLMSQQT